MGISPFSDSCGCKCMQQPQAPNPNPYDFGILNYHTFWDKDDKKCLYLLATVHYPACTTYNGRKILVYENVTPEELLKRTTLDPHFLEDADLYPIARFPANKKGMGNAFQFVRSLVGDLEFGQIEEAMK